jgi:hypothetical protein
MLLLLPPDDRPVTADLTVVALVLAPDVDDDDDDDDDVDDDDDDDVDDDEDDDDGARKLDDGAYEVPSGGEPEPSALLCDDICVVVDFGTLCRGAAVVVTDGDEGAERRRELLGGILTSIK